MDADFLVIEAAYEAFKIHANTCPVCLQLIKLADLQADRAEAYWMLGYGTCLDNITSGALRVI